MRALKKTFKKIVKKLFIKRGVPFFDLLIEEFLRKNKEMFFIQIGANDGMSFDPIYEFVTDNPKNVRGILLEPVKEYFDELETNYKKHPNVITLNLAVHNSNKEMVIHRADPEKIDRSELPKWTKGIASFNKDHHKRSDIHKEAMIEEKVKCISINDLIKKHNVTKIDLLQIDTEGYDAEIILNLDYNVIRPKIIHFEHGLASGMMSQEIFLNVTDILHNNGYEIWMDSADATAYQRNVIVNLEQSQSI